MEFRKTSIFPDRTYAAFLLEESLRRFANSKSVILAIPRGGITIGYHLARLLNLPLDLAMCKKIGHAANSEYAIGSVNKQGAILNDEAELGAIPKDYIQSETRRIQRSLEKHYTLLMQGKKPIDLKDKNVIIVDDGIATGYTMLACLQAIRMNNPTRIIIAVPVASQQAISHLGQEADEVICLHVTPNFHSVAQFYESFNEVTDDEAKKMINKLYSEHVTSFAYHQ